MNATTSATLATIHPDRAEFDGRRVVLGWKCYALLRAVIGRGGRIKATTAHKSLYGPDLAMNRGRLDTVINRVNNKLADLRYPRRLCFDRGTILFI